ncbi:MAG: hypothetical protein LBD34_03450 [Puniceicoccales bacterium]|nr:hypothetical protein [Puniceicoccales bacterium]
MVITANMSGKVKTGLQIVSTGIMILWFVLTRDFGRSLKPHYISWIRDGGILLFLYSTYLTIASGISETLNHRKLLVDS